MAIKYDVVATVGSYKNSNGEKKYLNKKVGQVIDTQHGPALKLDASFSPSGCPISEDGSIWLKLYEPKPKDLQAEGASNPNRSSNGQAQKQSVPQDSFDDDLSF